MMSRILFSVLTALLLQSSFALAEVCSSSVVRGAFDVGSAETKLKVARINTCTRKIVEVLYSSDKEKQNEQVDYRGDVENAKHKGEFSEPVQAAGIAGIQRLQKLALEALKEKGVSQQPDMWAGVATEAFRLLKEDSAKAFVARLKKETKVNLMIIPQESEALLEITGVAARPEFNLDQIVVVGIGGGSMQIETRGKDRKYAYFSSSIGSKKFATKLNMEVKGITDKTAADEESPHPLFGDDKDKAIAKAEKLLKDVIEGGKSPSALLDKVAQSKTDANIKVVGIGGVISHGLKDYIDDGKRKEDVQPFFTIDEAKAKLDEWISETDAELPASDYKRPMVSNVVLVYGVMKQLGVSKVYTADVNLADGLLFLTQFLSEGAAILTRQVASSPTFQACKTLAGKAAINYVVGSNACSISSCKTVESCEDGNCEVLGNRCVGKVGNSVISWSICK